MKIETCVFSLEGVNEKIIRRTGIYGISKLYEGDIIEDISIKNRKGQIFIRRANKSPQNPTCNDDGHHLDIQIIPINTEFDLPPYMRCFGIVDEKYLLYAG